MSFEYIRVGFHMANIDKSKFKNNLKNISEAFLEDLRDLKKVYLAAVRANMILISLNKINLSPGSQLDLEEMIANLDEYNINDLININFQLYTLILKRYEDLRSVNAKDFAEYTSNLMYVFPIFVYMLTIAAKYDDEILPIAINAWKLLNQTKEIYLEAFQTIRVLRNTKIDLDENDWLHRCLILPEFTSINNLQVNQEHDDDHYLAFKSKAAAFDMACNCLQGGDIIKGNLMMGIIESSLKEVPSIFIKDDNKGLNILVKIASSEGGVQVFAFLPYITEELKDGDLVLWQPLQEIKNNAAHFTCWTGPVVAKIKPAFKTKSGWLIDKWLIDPKFFEKYL